MNACTVHFRMNCYQIKLHFFTVQTSSRWEK
jgi:hypothetical protein